MIPSTNPIIHRSNPDVATKGASVQVKKYTTWLNMNHCQYIKYKMSNPADCTTGASIQVKNIQHD